MKKILLAIVTLLATMNTNAQIIKVFANDDTFPIDYFINDANHKYKFVFQETSAVDQVFKCVKVNGHYVYVTLEDDAVGDVSISTQINGETVSVSAQSQSGKYLKLTADNCAKSGKVISGETTAYEWELSNITDNVSAVVEYTDKQSFTITIAENLEHGSIKSTTPSGICAWGETVMVKLAPDEGYFVESIKYNDGTDHDITDTGSFTMPQANVTITATFEEIPIYTEGSFSAPGIKIGGVWWAPVNCGYDATYHPYGSLYQWGRKYGQACELGKDISFGLMQKTDDTEANKDKFGYFNSGFFYNWYEAAINAFDNTMWNGTTKGENDPSPDGWRVPSMAELSSLIAHCSSGYTTVNGVKGYWFSQNYPYCDSEQKMFIPACGHRDPNFEKSRGELWYVNKYGYYWSSTSFTESRSVVYAWYLTFQDNIAPHLYNQYPVWGFSVRCVKDDNYVAPEK